RNKDSSDLSYSVDGFYEQRPASTPGRSNVLSQDFPVRESAQSNTSPFSYSSYPKANGLYSGCNPIPEDMGQSLWETGVFDSFHGRTSSPGPRSRPFSNPNEVELGRRGFVREIRADPKRRRILAPRYFDKGTMRTPPRPVTGEIELACSRGDVDRRV